MGRHPYRLGLLAVSLLLAGCLTTSTSSSGLGFPAGPQVDHYGLRLRCVRDEDSSCSDRAIEVVGEIMARLGAPTDGAQHPAKPLIPPFTITASRDPAWEWRSSDGTSGLTTDATIDLDPFLSGEGFASAELNSGASYVVPMDLAQQLVDALFVEG